MRLEFQEDKDGEFSFGFFLDSWEAVENVRITCISLDKGPEGPYPLCWKFPGPHSAAAGLRMLAGAMLALSRSLDGVQ